jgi:hypothetical protein
MLLGKNFILNVVFVYFFIYIIVFSFFEIELKVKKEYSITFPQDILIILFEIKVFMIMY